MSNPPTLGQQLAALRQPRERRCLACGKAFTTVFEKQRYCSGACRLRAFRAKRREAQR